MGSWREEQIGDCRLICADARDVSVECDCVITDPPYPDIDKGFAITPIDFLDDLQCRQLVFWSAVEAFPLEWSAIHIWHKPNGNSSQHYERIFERNGHGTCKVYRNAAILPNYEQYKRECVDHPTQKPLSLLLRLVERISASEDIVFDPFMGSGTTLVACAMMGRHGVGIEIEPKYFDIACRRIEAAYAQPRLFSEPSPKPHQEALFDTVRESGS